MRRIGNSFLALVCAGLVLETAGAASALLGLDTLARCYWAWFPGAGRQPDVCAEPIPIVGFHLFIPAAILGLLVIGTFLVGSSHALRLYRGVTRLKAQLGPRAPFTPPAVIMAADVASARDVELRDYDHPYAACIGLLRPAIVVSTGLVRSLEPTELVAVLAHEERHRRRRAPLRQLVARATARAFFFLPILDTLVEAHLVDEEVFADREACEVAGRSSLVRALAKLSTANGELALTSPIAGAGTLVQRLDVLEGGSRAGLALGRARIALSVLFLALLTLVVVWMPVAGPR